MAWADSWTPLVASSQTTWGPIVCSSDGTKILAASNDNEESPQVSLDSGATWTANAPEDYVDDYYFLGLFCASDFSLLIAPTGGDQVLTSTDSGASWDYSAPTFYYGYAHTIAASSDGQIVYIGTGDTVDCMKSTDGLGTISSLPYNGSTNVIGFACSSNGATVYHTQFAGIYKSTNGGTDWIINELDHAYNCVDCSASGSVVIAGRGSNASSYVAVTTDGGANWAETQVDATTLTDAFAVACNPTGQYMLAGGQTGNVLASDDYGATWHAVEIAAGNLPIGGFAISDDGSVAYATVNGDYIYALSAASLSIDSITPSSGTTLGGTPVTITGSGFTASTTVTIGGNAVDGLTFVSDTELTGTTPPGTVGAKDVTVTNP